MKKVIAFILAIIMTINMGSGIEIKADTIKGQCGPNATYVLKKNKLTISGTGKIDKNIYGTTIKKVIIEEGITEIGDGVFYDWEDLTSVEIPESVTTICDEAFEDCASLKSIVIPDSVISIGKFAFSGCDNLETIKLSKNLRCLARGIFSDSSKLKNVEIPSKVKAINTYAFSDTGIEEIVIPDSVEKIGKYAFMNCTNLKSIVIGKSVKSVPKSFIKKCYKIKKIKNKSQATIKLNDFKGKKTWKVNGKKVTTLKPGKTAKCKGKKIKIQYLLDKGKVKSGKKYKYYYYGEDRALPKMKRKGYTFFGWNVFGKNDWFLFTDKIDGTLYGKIKVAAMFKKYKVENVKGGKIKVTVKDPDYGKRGYEIDNDRYRFRYSEYEDMRDASEHVYTYTYPYGDGISPKLKKGKTYYVEIALETDWEEDSEDMDTPVSGWIMKKKIKIKK